MIISYLGLIVGGLLHHLTVDFVTQWLKLVTVHENRFNAIDFVLVLKKAEVSRVSHDACKTFQGHFI